MRVPRLPAAALGLTVAVTVATGVAFAAYTLGSSAGANSSYLPASSRPDAPPVTGEPGDSGRGVAGQRPGRHRR